MGEALTLSKICLKNECSTRSARTAEATDDRRRLPARGGALHWPVAAGRKLSARPIAFSHAQIPRQCAAANGGQHRQLLSRDLRWTQDPIASKGAKPQFAGSRTTTEQCFCGLIVATCLTGGRCGMPRSRSFARYVGFPFLIVMSSCSDKLECDSIETRKAVLQIVADDHRNPLINYAAKNSNAKASSENAKPLYLLGQRIVTTATSQDKRTLQCSGEISVSVGDTNASKEVDFTVQQSPGGKISVSVVPFQF
jgi:hypothetical protein